MACEHLFECREKIFQRIARARHILLLSDYDGTLTPIVEIPEMAVLDPEIQKLLSELSFRKNFHIGIISGRTIRDLQSKINIRGIIYAGNHGLQIEGPGISFTNPVTDDMRTVINVLYRVLTNALSGIKGVFVENKQLTLSVHYRMADPKEINLVRAIFYKVTGTASVLGKIRITFGKKVYEVRPPVKWDKGNAVKLIWDKYFATMGKNSVAFYLGDDLTDEDGFAQLNRLNGISILVGDGERPTSARYYLKSTNEVRDFLELMLKSR